jgi:hypothetical protein
MTSIAVATSGRVETSHAGKAVGRILLSTVYAAKHPSAPAKARRPFRATNTMYRGFPMMGSSSSSKAARGICQRRAATASGCGRLTVTNREVIEVPALPGAA